MYVLYITVYTKSIHSLYDLLAWENNFKVKIHSQLGLNLREVLFNSNTAVAVPKFMILRADEFHWIRGMFYFINSIN